MKTAISIPDEVFEAAETLADSLGLSRSELYVRAMREYLERQRRENVTERLNQVYAQDADGLDPVLAKIQLASLPREEW